MSNFWLFVVGVVVTIPVAAGVVGLILAAIADGRTNDRIQQQQASSTRNS